MGFPTPKSLHVPLLGETGIGVGGHPAPSVRLGKGTVPRGTSLHRGRRLSGPDRVVVLPSPPFRPVPGSLSRLTLDDWRGRDGSPSRSPGGDPGVSKTSGVHPSSPTLEDRGSVFRRRKSGDPRRGVGPAPPPPPVLVAKGVTRDPGGVHRPSPRLPSRWVRRRLVGNTVSRDCLGYW